MSRIPVPASPSLAPPAPASTMSSTSSRPPSSRRPESVYSASGSSFVSSSAVPSTPPAGAAGDALAETRKRQSRRDEVGQPFAPSSLSLQQRARRGTGQPVQLDAGTGSSFGRIQRLNAGWGQAPLREGLAPGGTRRVGLSEPRRASEAVGALTGCFKPQCTPRDRHQRKNTR